MNATPQKLLQIEDLVLHFKTRSGTVQAVDGVDFELDTNRAVVILGESGCGKSSLAKAILRLLPRNVEKYSGEVYPARYRCDDDLMKSSSVRMYAGRRSPWCRRPP